MTAPPPLRPQGCFHCGEAVPAGAGWRLTVEGQERSFCCGGCQAVANTILAAGLGAFYRQRTGPAGATTTARALEEALAEAQRLGAAATVAAESRARQRPAGDDAGRRHGNGNANDECGVDADRRPRRRASRSASPGVPVDRSTEVDLAVEGMHCGACVWLIEQGLQAEPGVLSVGVNLATERARVSFDATATTLTRLLEIVARLGYRARPFDAGTREQDLAAYARRSRQRIFVAGLGMMQVMMYALPAYVAGGDDIETQYVQLLRWASLVLTTPVIFYSAWPFFLGAWQTLRHGRVGMDVPVSIGLAAAFVGSVYSTVTGTGEVYFDSVAMFTFLLLLARHLQWMIRRRALAQIDAVGAAAPDAVWRIVADRRELVPPGTLEPRDRIAIETGQMIPVDSMLISGDTTVDQSVLTGESVPVRVRSGAAVAAGSVVTGPPAQLDVVRRIEHSAVSRLEGMVARGLSEKPRWAQLADRVATVFVAAVLLLAAVIWIVWMQIDPDRAWPIAMTVLVVSCPCALSLATPSALSAVTGALMRDGMLLTRGDALESLANATDVVFDKTGTLTQGQPALTQIDTDPALSRAVALQIAAAMEAGVAHPYAEALRREAPPTDPTILPDEAFGEVEVTDHRAGQGVTGVWRRPDGTATTLRLGSATWCALGASDRERWPGDPTATEIFLATGTMGDPDFRRTDLLGRFLMKDPIRPTSADAIARLQDRGLQVHLLSGDRLEVVAGVAMQLGVDRYSGGALPEAKQAAVRAMQAEGRRVVMVGDGLNDAPVLSLADVSIAIGQASDLARTAADVILLKADPLAVVAIHEQAQRTRRIIAQNLAWSAIYNAIAIPVAAFGWVPPWAAAIGMAASSWLVVTNAARLWPARRSAPRRAASVAASAPGA